MSMFSNRTAASTQATAVAAPAASAAPSRSKYGGIVCSDTRDPMPGIGTYRFKVLACSEGYNPGKRRDSYKVALRVLDAAPGSETPKGATVTVVSFATPAGLSELKRFAMHAAGCGLTLEQRESCSNIKAELMAAEAKFDAFDEHHGYQGSILESSAGRANGAPSLVGSVIDCIVTKGRDIPNPQTGAATGDFFRVYTWGVVPDSDSA